MPLDPKQVVAEARAKGLILTAEEVAAEQLRNAPRKIIYPPTMKTGPRRYVCHRKPVPLLPVTKNGESLYIIAPYV